MLASVMRDVWPETFTFLPAGSLPEAEARLAAGGIDCVLAEPAGSACAPLAPAVPVVVLTDQADEERALAAVRAGAQDVLAKGADGGRRGPGAPLRRRAQGGRAGPARRRPPP